MAFFFSFYRWRSGVTHLGTAISKGVPIFFGVVKVETTRIMIVSKLLRP